MLSIIRTLSSIAALCRPITGAPLGQLLLIHVSSVECRQNAQSGYSIRDLHFKHLLPDLSAKLFVECAKLINLPLMIKVHRQMRMQLLLQKQVYSRAFQDWHTRNAPRCSPSSAGSLNSRCTPRIICYTVRNLDLRSCKIV